MRAVHEQPPAQQPAEGPWSLDPSVGVAYRYWASVVRMDRQAEGTLPPHTFVILLMYFLQQQTKSVLPCIHEYLEPSNVDVYN